MLAVLSLAAISRSCSALAIAGPSFSAVARGTPSIGAIATLALSRNAKIGAPRRGTSSANGCGSGWQPAAGSRAVSNTPRSRIGPNEPLKSKDRRVCPKASGLITKRDRRESTTIGALALQTGTPIAEETLIFSNRVVNSTRYGDDAGAAQPALDIARQVEPEMAGPHCRREVSRTPRVLREKLLREFRPDLV